MQGKNRHTTGSGMDKKNDLHKVNNRSGRIGLCGNVKLNQSYYGAGRELRFGISSPQLELPLC